MDALFLDKEWTSMGSKIKQVAFGAVVAGALLLGAYNGGTGEVRIAGARDGIARMTHILLLQSTRLAVKAATQRDTAVALVSSAFAARAVQLNQH
jgi:hypothetical protein